MIKTKTPEELAIEKRETELVLANLGLVVSQLKKYTPTAFLDKDDLQALGTMGLLKAIRKHDPQKSQLSTYAYHIIKNEILTEIKSKKNKLKTISINSNKDHAELHYSASEAISDYLPELNAEEENIIKYKLSGHTIKEIASLIQSEPSYVTNKLQIIYKKIKNANR